MPANKSYGICILQSLFREVSLCPKALVEGEKMNYNHENLRVLYIGAGLGYDGSSKMLSYTVKELNSIFKNVFILVHDLEKNKAFKHENETILYYEDYKAQVAPSSPIKRLLNYIRIMKAIRNTVIKNSIDVAIVFTANKMVLAKLALINWKGKLIGAERGAPHTKKKFWIILSKILFPKYDGLVFQTKKAQDFYGEKIKAISTVIPNPYIVKGEEIKPYFGLREKSIVSAGRLCRDKGFDILIDAFSVLSKRYPEYKLYIYGEGPEKEKLQKQIENLNLCDKAFLCGFTENVAKSIRKDGIFVLSSRTEGIPNVLLEAMGVGIPCVATNCASGGPAMLLKNNERGILAEPNSVDSLVNSIAYLIDNPEVANELGKRAAEAMKEFSYDKVFEQWKKFILSKL